MEAHTTKAPAKSRTHASRIAPVATHCCLCVCGILTVKAPEHGCDHANDRGYDHVLDVILSANVNAGFRSIAHASLTSECSRGVDLAKENGSVNESERGYGHDDCANGSWPNLAEHRSKPSSRPQRIRWSCEARAILSTPPHMCPA
jgi:hypothetical protein